MSPARARPVRSLVAALLGATAVLGLPAPRPARADPPAAQAPWEREVEQESAALDRELADAKRRGVTRSVVVRYESRVARDPTALNRFLLGRALYHNGDPAGAATQMRLALETDARFYPAHVKLAVLQYDLKSYAQAEVNLAEALRLRPDDDEATKLLVRIAEDTKDWPKARRHLEALLARSPGDPLIRQNLAWVYIQQRAWDDALRELRVLRARDPRNADLRLLYADALREQSQLAEAAKELEGLLAENPQDVRVLDRLRLIYTRQKDWARVQGALEKMLPLVDPDKRALVAELIAELRKGPPDEAAPEEPKRLTWDDVFEECRSPVLGRRRQALAAVFEGASKGQLRQVPGHVLQRIDVEREPDPTCRGLVLRILGTLDVEALPMVSFALYDEDAGVRLLAVETFEDLKQPGALAYLWPLLLAPERDLTELSAIRSALTALTGHRDLAAGNPIRTAEEAAAVREAWRRWRLSDDSRDAKLAAVRQMAALTREPYLERYLVDFVQDSSFDVMRVAYLALRTSVTRPPRDPVERKMFPLFPLVADAELDRANMRALQQRVGAWWSDWVAERWALVKAKGK